LEADVARELLGQQNWFGELALADVALDRGDQALMERLEKVAGLQVVTDPFESGVVIEQPTEQSLPTDEKGGLENQPAFHQV
jgi:hypothetical protein